MPKISRKQKRTEHKMRKVMLKKQKNGEPFTAEETALAKRDLQHFEELNKMQNYRKGV